MVIKSAGMQAECNNGFSRVKPTQTNTTGALLRVENKRCRSFWALCCACCKLTMPSTHTRQMAPIDASCAGRKHSLWRVGGADAYINTYTNRILFNTVSRHFWTERNGIYTAPSVMSLSMTKSSYLSYFAHTNCTRSETVFLKWTAVASSLQIACLTILQLLVSEPGTPLNTFLPFP